MSCRKFFNGAGIHCESWADLKVDSFRRESHPRNLVDRTTLKSFGNSWNQRNLDHSKYLLSTELVAHKLVLTTSFISSYGPCR